MMPHLQRIDKKRFFRLTVRLPFFLCLILWTPQGAGAEQRLLVGVSANYMMPFRELAAAFEKQTGVAVKPTFGATGNLHSQIMAGAPYDLFLAADEGHPENLLRKGLSERPFAYAVGSLVLWTARRDACRFNDWRAALQGAAKRRVAAPQPEVSPYGASARLAMKKAGLWEQAGRNLVYAQDLAQAFQYAKTGGVSMAFLSLSYALSEQGREGCYYPVAEAPPVRQTACVMRKARNRPAAESFCRFLLSGEAAAVRKKFGYE